MNKIELIALRRETRRIDMEKGKNLMTVPISFLTETQLSLLKELISNEETTRMFEESP